MMNQPALYILPGDKPSSDGGRPWYCCRCERLIDGRIVQLLWNRTKFNYCSNCAPAGIDAAAELFGPQGIPS